MTEITKRDYGNPLFDIFDDFFTPNNSRRVQSSMKTDIIEVENGYELNIDVPGFGKENIHISLDNGYLTIEAKKEETSETENLHYLQKERFFGKCARSFYVGDEISQEDIKAKYDKGILNMFIPKEGTNKKVVEYIDIT